MTTTDHNEIQSWAEKHGAKPAAVSSTGSGGDPGILRLMFPDAPQHDDDSLEQISWGEWLQAFDDNGLALVYEPDSNFNKLVSRANVEA